MPDVHIGVRKTSPTVTIGVRREQESISIQTSYHGARPHEVYHGAYSAIPKVVQQTLDTDDKVLLSDVVVEAIPYVEIPNSADGLTVRIGDD